ncbi:hypothetical protein JHK82_039631 [Glycine max]|nr:hypothetical protein JHK87_039609 [Glycine soja]KAG4962954.1 hypothetical protein JHK86_039822 [Glycine max]KAG5110408.1 hypothetical protein JHK82_039631 [Glycine max]
MFQQVCRAFCTCICLNWWLVNSLGGSIARIIDRAMNVSLLILWKNNFSEVIPNEIW